MHPEQPRDPSPRRWPRNLVRAILVLLVAAAAVPVLFNLLLIAGFWLNPPIQPDEEEQVAAGLTLAPVPIQASDLGGEWPLRAPSGHLNCFDDGAITFAHQAEHALNPEARALGYPDVAEIAKPGAGTEPLLRRAREMCARALAP